MIPNPQENAELDTFTEEILKRKLHFCAVWVWLRHVTLSRAVTHQTLVVICFPHAPDFSQSVYRRLLKIAVIYRKTVVCRRQLQDQKKSVIYRKNLQDCKKELRFVEKSYKLQKKLVTCRKKLQDCKKELWFVEKSYKSQKKLVICRKKCC